MDGTRVLKSGRSRSVRLEPRGGGAVVVKRFAHRDRWSRLGDRARAEREFRWLVELARAGLPVPRALGLREVDGGFEVELEPIDGARTLDSELDEPRGDLDALVRPLARALAALHALGLDHPDLHPGNVLLDRDRSPWLIDFHAARKRKRLAAGAAHRDLVSLAASVRERIGPRWRARFWLAWRAALPPALARPVPDRELALARLAREARARRLDVVRERAERFVEDGRAVRAVDAGRWRGFELASAPAGELERRASELVDDPRERAGGDAVLRGPRARLARAWRNAARLNEHRIAAFAPAIFVTAPRAAILLCGPDDARAWRDGSSAARADALGELVGRLLDRGLWIPGLEARDLRFARGRAWVAFARELVALDSARHAARDLPVVRDAAFDSDAWTRLRASAIDAVEGGRGARRGELERVLVHG